MTLIVTEVSRAGIVMAGDSAITETYPAGWTLGSGRSVGSIVRTGAQKVIPVRSSAVGIGVWGFATVHVESDLKATIPIDRFVLDFASTIPAGTNVEEIASRLADAVNRRIDIGAVRGGFHIAGFESPGNKRHPVVYHVHTGHDANGPHGRLTPIRDLPDGVPMTVDEWHRSLENGARFYLRNGQLGVYAVFHTHVTELMKRLEQEVGFKCPGPMKFKSELEEQTRFLVLQLEIICEFYKLSNCLEIVAMPISSLAMSTDGIVEYLSSVI